MKISTWWFRLFTLMLTWQALIGYSVCQNHGVPRALESSQATNASQQSVWPEASSPQALLAEAFHAGTAGIAATNPFAPSWLRGFTASSPESRQTAHEMDFAYYSRRDGFKSVLRLVSATPAPILFSITVHNMSGTPFVLPAMNIAGQSSLVLDLDAVLRSAPSSFVEGSASVTYVAAGNMPLAGQITIENPELHLAYESRMVENDPGMSQLSSELYSVWWGSSENRNVSIAVSNTAGEAVNGEIVLDIKGSRHAGKALYFAPHETKLLDLLDLLNDVEIPDIKAQQGGITIRFKGPGTSPSLIAQGRVLDFGSGFSTTLNFTSRMSMTTNVFHASGVPLGIPSADSPYAGMGDFTPHAILRNLLETRQTFAITLSYPLSNGTGQYTISASLAKYEVRDISFKSALEHVSRPVPFASIRIEGSGPAGSAAGEVSSIDRGDDLVVDSYLVNEGDNMHANSGMNPWRLDQQTESILFLTNTGSEEAKIGMQIESEGFHYFVTNILLQPHEIRAVNLRTLRDGQKPDFRGNKLPRNASQGNLLWSKLKGPTVMGRLLMIAKGQGVSSSFSCGTDCSCGTNYSRTEITSNNSVTLTVGQSYRFTAQDLYLDCYNNEYWYDVYFGWSTDNPTIAGIGSDGTLTAYSTGSVTVTIDDGGGCLQESDGNGNCNCISEDWPGQGNATVLPIPEAELASPTDQTYYEATGQSEGKTVSGFEQTVSDSLGDSFSGQYVQEQPGPTSQDNCWFPGSAESKITSVSGGLWTVSANNTYGPDWIGAVYSFNEYYVLQGRAPCTVTQYQVMQIQVNGAWVTYTNPYKVLTIDVGDPTTDCKTEWSSGSQACAPSIYW